LSKVLSPPTFDFDTAKHEPLHQGEKRHPL
jgi:hypothetical protein